MPSGPLTQQLLVNPEEALAGSIVDDIPLQEMITFSSKPFPMATLSNREPFRRSPFPGELCALQG